MCDRAKYEEELQCLKDRLSALEKRMIFVEKTAGKSSDVPRRLPKSERHI